MAITKKQITEHLSNIGVVFDQSSKKADLLSLLSPEEIVELEASSNVSGEGGIECELLRDFWDEDGVRHEKGKVVSIPAEAALDGVESGALKRVKAK